MFDKETTPKETGSSTRQWKDTDHRKRIPSGKKLTWDPDGDCVLRFVGYREVPDPGTGEIYKYLAFTDGQGVVSCHESFAFQQVVMKPDSFYYFHNNGEIPTKMGAMNDLEIVELGTAGETIEGIPSTYAVRLCAEGENSFKCDDAVMKELNFTRLNYCHRTLEKGKEKVDPNVPF